MQRPYICAACQAHSGIRSRVLHLATARWSSSSAAPAYEQGRYRQSSDRHAQSRPAHAIRRPGPAQDNHEAPIARPAVQRSIRNSETQIKHETPIPRPLPDVEEPVVKVGRYSRKPLLPEQLLQQLDQPSTGVSIPGPIPGPIPDPIQPPSTPADTRPSERSSEHIQPAGLLDQFQQTTEVQRSAHAEVHASETGEEQRKARQDRQDRRAQAAVSSQRWAAQLEDFQTCVSQKQWNTAIQILLDLQNTKGQQAGDDAVHWLSTAGLAEDSTMMRSIRELTRVCVQTWSQRLCLPEYSGPTLPSPVQLQKLLRELSLAPKFIWKYVLWHAASSASEARVTSIAERKKLWVKAALELVELWRLASISKPKVPERNGHVSAADRHGKDSGQFDLPNRETMETYLREHPGDEHNFNHLLLLAFPYKMHAHNLGDLLIDYASVALVTLNMLRSVGSRIAQDSSMSASDRTNVKAFHDFLELCLELSPPTASPPQIRHTLRNKNVDSYTETHYITFLAKMGIASGLTPFETAKRFLQRPQAAVDSNVVLDEAVADPVQDEEDATNVSTNDSPAVPLDPEESALKDTRLAFSKPVPAPIAEYARSAIKQLGRAREKVNLMTAQKVQNDAFQLAATSPDLNAEDPLPIELYEHLILTFLALRHPHSAVEVWDHLIRRGHQPTVRTYTVMIRGARASRDLTGMEEFWLRMRNSGIQPDEFAYSAMIYGLIRLGKPKRGLQILDMMGKEWATAATKQHELKQRATAGSKRGSTPPPLKELLKAYPGSIGKIPRPNVTTINAAVTALASVRGHEVMNVIKWARAFGIEPDIITFNTLINLAMRQGNEEEAQGLLQHMRSRGIDPDSTTWSVLLAALFHSDFLRGLSPDEQLQKLTNLIDSTKDAEGKVTLDLKGYALIIDRLLKVYDNPAAASAILDIMIAQGKTPSTHIFTIVLTSYFAQQPPNLAGVMQLWTRLTSGDWAKTRNVDTVFFDRMIEGLAAVHREIGIRPALDIHSRAEREGKMPGWRALEAIARALWDRYDEPYCSARLHSLVADVRGRLETSRGTVQTDSQYDFWAFIISTRRVLESEIRQPADLLRSKPVATPMVRALRSGQARQ